MGRVYSSGKIKNFELYKVELSFICDLEAKYKMEIVKSQ